MKLTEVEYEVPIEAPTAETWKLLSRFGDVGEFLSVVATAHSLNGTGVEAGLEVERHCKLPNGRRMIQVSERITSFAEGKSYTYDVFAWQNIPLA